MSISYPPLSAQVATSVSTVTLVVTTTSTQIIPANPGRGAGALLVNNTNKILWIRLDTSTNPVIVGNASSIAIPANGGNYGLPSSYQGAVQGALAAVARNRAVYRTSILMPTIRQEQYLWLSLCLLVFGVFVLGVCDPALRPQVLDFAKIALGGILGLLTARAVPPKIG